MTPGNVATQKGDVYSFAIILEEIVIRGGPYEVARTFMTSQEVYLLKTFNGIYIFSHVFEQWASFHQIVNRVAASESPPFRPEVAQKECPADILSLMEKCWNEVPEERPTFHAVRGTIRGIMKYENIFKVIVSETSAYIIIYIALIFL